MEDWQQYHSRDRAWTRRGIWALLFFSYFAAHIIDGIWTCSSEYALCPGQISEEISEGWSFLDFRNFDGEEESGRP